MNERLLIRAQQLMERQKYKEAAQVLSDLMQMNPNDTEVLGMYSQVALRLGQKEKADDLVSQALSIAPDNDYLYFIKSKVMLEKEQYDEAEKYLKEAIQIDPQYSDYYASWASIKLARKQFQAALDLSNQALERDAENILALNTRSTAQLKLNQKEASFKTILGALKEDPKNAYTHANYGWNLLEKGDHKKALEHFKESLRQDPNYQYAQAGMVEALKAKYVVYRWFLKYAFWMSNMTSKYQWGVILGFYFGYRLLRKIAENNPQLSPILTPILVILAVAAFSTWVIGPISNLFLRLNPYGKHLLEKKEIQSSNFVGISFLVCVLGLLLSLILQEQKWLALAAFGFAMMIPLGVMFSPTKTKNSLLIYATAMFLVGFIAVTKTIITGELFNLYSIIFLFGLIAFQFLANFLMIKESNI